MDILNLINGCFKHLSFKPMHPAEDNYDEESLMKAFQKADKQACRIVYNMTLIGVYSFVNGLLHDEAVADQIVSDCYYDLFQKCESLPSIAKIKAALYIDARQRALEYQRSKTTIQASTSRPPAPPVFNHN